MTTVRMKCFCGEWDTSEYGIVCPSCPPELVAAVDSYRDARAAYDAAGDAADLAFNRWFRKVQAGEPTNAAGATRLANQASYRSADLAVAQGRLFRLEVDPWDIDDFDGHDRTFVG